MSDENKKEEPLLDGKTFGCNGQVAAAPFESFSIQKTVNSGFATAKNKTQMFSTTIIFPSLDGPGAAYPAGTRIWVDGADSTLEYAKRIYDVGGRKFILVPANRILMCALPKS